MEVLSNRWIAAVAGIWIQCSAGAYTFSIYSSALKSSQGYDQSTLDTVSVYKDIGGSVGVLSGLLYSAVTPKRRRSSGTGQLGGPWVVLLVGAVQCFVGYFFIWAAVAGVVQRPPVPVMCFFMLLAAHSQSFFSTANVVCGVQNFSYYGGTIVGIMKGFLGLSGAISVQIYEILCKGNPTTFLLMLSLWPTMISLFLMFFVRVYETRNTASDKKYLNAFFAIALLIVAYRMIIIILENMFAFPSWAQIYSFIFLLLLIASPLGIAIKAQIEDSESNRISGADFGYHSEYEQLPGSDNELILLLQKEEDMNLFQAISSINFWLLFVAMVCGMGSAIATINNMSQLGQSLGYKTKETNSFVALLSIWNFLGRLGSGFISDFLLNKKGLARPLLMAITLAAMAIGHIIIAPGFSGNLYLGSILVGICYGSQWALMPTITSEIFGIGQMATIFNTIAISSPVGSYIFSVRVIGYIYDRETSKEGDGTCWGTQCFMLSFMIMAFFAFLGFLVAILLFFRTKRFYHQLVVLRKLEHPLRG